MSSTEPPTQWPAIEGHAIEENDCRPKGRSRICIRRMPRFKNSASTATILLSERAMQYSLLPTSSEWPMSSTVARLSVILLTAASMMALASGPNPAEPGVKKTVEAGSGGRGESSMDGQARACARVAPFVTLRAPPMSVDGNGEMTAGAATSPCRTLCVLQAASINTAPKYPNVRVEPKQNGLLRFAAFRIAPAIRYLSMRLPSIPLPRIDITARSQRHFLRTLDCFRSFHSSISAHGRDRIYISLLSGKRTLYGG